MPRAPFIDGFEFATSAGRMAGEWPVDKLPRLRERLASMTGTLHYELGGVRDEQGRAALKVHITGSLDLVCQRCLEPTRFGVNVEAILALAASQEALDREPVAVDGPDWILAGREMPVADLLEDELLLAVPVAARHEGCRQAADAAGTNTGSPFAALKGLLRNGSPTNS